MAMETTEIKVMNEEGDLMYIFHKKGNKWKMTHESDTLIGWPQGSIYHTFDTIKDLNFAAGSRGYHLIKNKTLVMFRATGKDRVRRYSFTKKGLDYRKLSVWLKADELAKLHVIKQSLHEMGLIPKLNLEETLRYIINVHPKTPF